MARVRDYSKEFQSRNQRAVSAGFSSYSQMRRAGGAKAPSRYGSFGASTPGARPHASRRIHDAVGYDEDFAQDWEVQGFSSTRVDRARYSAERRELQVFWTNAPSGEPYPPYIYDAVDPATWQNFVISGSPGRYVTTNLDNFPFRKAPDLIGEF
jgi:hypothetical protein